MARQLMTMEQILSILRDTPERLRGLTGDLTEAELHAAPEPGEWSVTEIAAHLRSCADVWGQAIEAIAVTDHPTGLASPASTPGRHPVDFRLRSAPWGFESASRRSRPGSSSVWGDETAATPVAGSSPA
jgi:DinB superfamily